LALAAGAAAVLRAAFLAGVFLLVTMVVSSRG
jgi:hypothetical protein